MFNYYMYLFTYSGVQHDFSVRILSFDTNTTNATIDIGTDSGVHEFKPGFKWSLCYSIFSFMCIILLVIACLFILYLCLVFSLSFCDLWLLVTLLVSSNFSGMIWVITQHFKIISYSIMHMKRVWRYQRFNQNPYIEAEQTTQWPKEKVPKGQTTISKTNT